MVPGAIEIITRLVLAILIGGVLGSERERNSKPAGLRTHMLVCMASALVVIAALLTLADASMDSVSRVLTGLVTGIGFLGAGAIIRHEDHVEGLTTAATVWASAMLGITTGLGLYLLSSMATILVVAILYMGTLEEKLRG